MAVITGSSLRSARGGYENLAITPALRAYQIDYWPPSAEIARGTPKNAYASALPVEANGRVIDGYEAGSYRRDFYYRVHVIPMVLDLGNLINEQVREVAVWNAWLDVDVTVNAVLTQNADGIEVQGPADLPIVIGPLQQQVWTIKVSPSGPPVIDAALMWMFAGDTPPASVKVVGNRITAWMVPPDWASSITETLTWITDLQQAYDGSQTRLVCRESPRREWEFSAIAHARDRQILEAALYDWSARRWALPIWTDITWLASELAAGVTTIEIDTRGLDYVIGGLAALWSASWRFELVEILDVAAGALVLKNPTTKVWPRGSRLYPCRTAILTDTPSIPRTTSNLVQTQVRFLAAEPCDWPAVAPAANYLGYPVLEVRPDESSDIAAVHGRQMTLVDNDVGLPLIDDPTGLPWPTQAFNWLLSGRQDRAAHRSTLYWLQGRANALWLPSWTDDIDLSANIAADASVLNIDWIGYTRFLRERPGRRHIRIELKDGTVFYRRITASAEVDEDHETLALDTPLGRAVTRRQIRQLSWMMLASLNTDKVDIAHVHESVGIATSSVSFVGVPREEP